MRSVGPALVTLGLLASTVFLLIAVFSTLHQFGFSFLAWDQWRTYQTLLLQPFPENVLALESGHRPIFPKLLYLADLNWNAGLQTVLLWSGFGMALATILVWAGFLRSRKSLQHWQVAALVLVMAAGTVSGGNIRMLIQGYESLHVFPIVFAVTAVIALSLQAPATESLGWWRWIVIICLGLLSSFTFGPGPLIWPVLLLSLWLTDRPGKDWLIGVSLCLILLLTYIFVLPGASGVQNSMTINLGSALIASLQVSGSAVSYLVANSMTRGLSNLLATVAGSLCVVIAIIVVLAHIFVRSEQSKVKLAGCLLLVFGLATCCLIGFARSTYFLSHPGQVLAPRYVVWSNLAWAGLFIWLLSWVWSWQNRKLLAVLVTAMLLTPLLWGSLRFTTSAKTWSSYLSTNQLQLNYGLAMGITDPGRISAAAKSHAPYVLDTSRLLAPDRLGPYALPAAAWLNAPISPALNLGPAQGAVTLEETLADGRNGETQARIAGWVLPMDGADQFTHILVTDADDVVRGMAPLSLVDRSRAQLAALDIFTPIRARGYIKNYQPNSAYATYAVDATLDEPLTNAIPIAALQHKD